MKSQHWTTLAALLLTTAAFAATQNWNPDANTVWDVETTANWDNGAVWENDSEAVFSGGGTVTIDNAGGEVSAAKITFDDGGEYTFNGDALTLGASGLDNPAATARFENDIVPGANQTWNADGATTIAGGLSGGAFTLTKNGDGALVFDGASASFNGFAWNGGGLVMNNSFVTNTLAVTQINAAGGLVIRKSGASLTITNSTFNFTGSGGANFHFNTASGVNNTTSTLVDSFIDGNGHGVLIGNAGHGNTFTIDGTTFAAYGAGTLPITAGSGADASNNVIRISNGGYVYDNWNAGVQAANTLGFGAGANSNRIEIIGGKAGVVSTLHKQNQYYVGNTGALGNTIVVDGRGVAGSALFTGGNQLYLGQNGGHWSRMEIKDGGKVNNKHLYIGNNASNCRVDVTGQDAQLGVAGSFQLYVGLGAVASNNLLYVADGGSVTGFSNNMPVIGGSQAAGQQAVGNRLHVGPGGTVHIANNFGIGGTAGAGSFARGNQLKIAGANARFNMDNGRRFDIGHVAGAGSPAVGSEASGNELLIEDGGVMEWMSATGNPLNVIRVGFMAGKYGHTWSNSVVITTGGQLICPTAIHVGMWEENADDEGAHLVSSNNSLTVTSGGVLVAGIVSGNPAPVLTIMGPATTALTGPAMAVTESYGNTITFKDGGVYQFNAAPTATFPTLNSRTFGDISISNGVIAYAYNNASVNAHLNTQLTTVMAWSGKNAFRLNGVANPNTGSDFQSYTFEPNPFDPFQFARLELVNGITEYRTPAADPSPQLTIGAEGSMLCSNTTATVSMPFTCDGELAIINSTLTLKQPATLSGELVIDFNNLPENGIAIAAENGLTLNGAIRIIGTPPEGTSPPFITGASGRFASDNLPPNWFVKYDAAGNVFTHWAKSGILLILK